MAGTLSNLLRPVRRSGDYRGRSDRGELVCLWAYSLVLGGLSMILDAQGGVREREAFALAGSLLLMIPGVPAFVRRVHDVGWSGWWLLPTLPLAAYNLSVSAQRATVSYFDPVSAGWVLPDVIQLPLIGYTFGIFVLLLWDHQDGANRFGPNPRYSEQPEAELTSD